MFSVVKDIHAVLTPATSRVLTTGTVPADAAEVVVSYPALAPSAAIFLDAVLHTQELYHGELGGCSGFLMQCSLVFSRSSPLFPQRRCCSELMGGGKCWHGTRHFLLSDPLSFVPMMFSWWSWRKPSLTQFLRAAPRNVFWTSSRATEVSLSSWSSFLLWLLRQAGLSRHCKEYFCKHWTTKWRISSPPGMSLPHLRS